MKNSVIITLTGVILSLCSCTEENLSPGSTATGSEIRVKVNSIASPATKGPSGYYGSYSRTMSLEGSCLPAPLYLQEYIEDATAVTKGATVTTSSINIDGKSFLFDGWLESTGRYTSGSDASGVCDPNDETDYHFVDGVTVSHTGGAWTMSASAIWRNKVPTNFWSRYPVSLASGQGTLTVTLPGDTASDDEQKVLSLTYTMPAPGAVSGDTCVDAVAQQDLLFAYNSETWTDERGSNYVDVNFSHALAAVRFVFSDSFDADLSLSKIGINGIYTQGSCTVQGTASNNSVAYLWSSLAAKTTTPYWQTFSKEEITNGTTDANAKTFFIIPQTLSDDATVNVTFIHSDASTEDLSASLGGAAVTWEAGKVYTYKISANSIDYIYDFAVEIDSDTATTRSGDEEPFTSIDGQTVCFDNIFTSGLRHLKVISYKKKYNSDTKEPLAFTVEYSLDNGSTWKAFDADSLGVGGLSANYTGCVDTLLLDFTSVKKKVTPLGPFPFTATVSDQDLSLLDAAGDVIPNGRSTANCYVIHGAGTYKFPAVYGNAIANGMTNTPSYVSPLKAEGKTDNSQLWDFVNGLGAPITSPWVLEDRTDAVSGICADVLWMDAPGLISSVSLEANYISFSTAPVDSLMEGNAVIGLFVDNDSDGVYTYNTDAVLWSWHIWATAKDLSEDNCASIKDNKDNEYHMMPVNVGWASAASLRYDAPKASFLLRFVQAKDRRNAAPQLSCTIQSPQKTISYAGNSPYFQYGRKDPFLPAVVYDDEVHNKPWFTIGDKTGSEVFHREGEPLFPVVSGRYKATGGIYAPSNAIIAASISHPMTFAYNDNFDGTYTNLWDSCNSFNKLSSPKTVYDPTPYGYTLTLEYNNQKIFNVMKNKRDSGTDYQIVDGAVQFTDEDGEFSPSLNFYPTGRRIGKTDNTGETEDVGVRSYVWSCAPLFEDDSNPNSWTDFVFGCSPTTSNATLSYMTQKASGICLRPLHTNPEINAKISISDRIDEDVNVVNLI